jgi:hypothetical protein
MPPGVDERQNGGISPYHDVFQERFNQRYLRLVRKYSDIIVGQFFGHLHSDSFRIIYSDTGKIYIGLPSGVSAHISRLSNPLSPSCVSFTIRSTLPPGKEPLILIGWKLVESHGGAEEKKLRP